VVKWCSRGDDIVGSSITHKTDVSIGATAKKSCDGGSIGLKHFLHVTEGLRLVFHGWMAVTGDHFSMFSFGASQFAMVRVMFCW
jgi:hypothetical protein